MSFIDIESIYTETDIARFSVIESAMDYALKTISMNNTESFFLESESGKENIFVRLFKWLKDMIRLIIGKIKRLLRLGGGEVDVKKDVKTMHDITAKVCDGDEEFINNIREKLNGLKNNSTTIDVAELSEIIEQDMKMLEEKISELEKQIPEFTIYREEQKVDGDKLRRHIDAIKLLLKEYSELLNDIQPKGNKNVIKKLKSSIVNSEHGSGKNIMVYPILYTRTLYEDYTPCALCPRPMYDDAWLMKCFKKKLVVNTNKYYQSSGVDGNVYVAEYIKGFYICGIVCTFENFAKKLGYEFEEFMEPSRKKRVIKYFEDVVGRPTWGFMGYLIPEECLSDDSIPVFNHTDLLNIYLNYQQKYWMDKSVPRKVPTDRSEKLFFNK